jgi:SpoVK/Ycf46/Vps4 family AAA+-type ATPase
MVKQLVATRQNQAQRKAVGLKVQHLSPHLVFTGNPGTGKTTVARLVGRIYKELGLLESGHVVETERAGLIGGYVGQTAIKTLKVCESALGGVLFIDEAYAITNDSGLSFGQECIQTLLTFMENNRGNVAVVVAGYPVEMERFLGSNPGLRSRFDSTIHFPDYSASELEEIFLSLMKSNDYMMGEIALTKLRRVLQDLPTRGDYANGRDVRKLFQKVTTSQAARCVHKGLTTKGELKMLTTADITPHLAIAAKPRPVANKVNWVKFGYV